MAEAGKKLRVLCLHGFTQNELNFAESLSTLTESLKNVIEFTFITAPIALPAKEDDDEKNQQNDPKKARTCWWQANDGNTVYNGLEDSLSLIAKTVKDKGPFDGLMGFSQGGAMAAIVVAILHDTQNTMKQDLDMKLPRFVWLCSGFVGRAKKVIPLFFADEEQKKLNTFDKAKCLLCCSPDDQAVSMERAEALAQHFVDPVIIKYSGYKVNASDKEKQLRSWGHFVPDDAGTIAKYKAFFNQFL